MRAHAKIVYKFRRKLSCARGNVEEQNEALESSIIITNYYIIIIINAYYNYIVNEWYNCYISNKGLFEECDKKENVALNGAATASCLKRKL